MRLSSIFFPFFWKPITLHDNKLTSLQVSFTFTRKLYTQIYRFPFLMKTGHLLLAILTNSGTSRNCHCFQHYRKLQSDVFPFISKVLGSSYIWLVRLEWATWKVSAGKAVTFSHICRFEIGIQCPLGWSELRKE